MKVLSRLASPAGFGLVLLLFFVLPFLSVSCDVPGVGEAGVEYTGSHLVTGSDPTPMIPDQIKELVGQATGAADEPAPKPGVRLLAIALAVLAALGVLAVLVPRVRARLYGSAALAGLTLVVAIVTLLVAQSNIEGELLAQARETGATETQPGMPSIESLVDEMIRTKVGFWVVVAALALLLAGNLAGAFLARSRRSGFTGATTGGAVAGAAAGAAMPYTDATPTSPISTGSTHPTDPAPGEQVPPADARQSAGSGSFADPAAAPADQTSQFGTPPPADQMGQVGTRPPADPAPPARPAPPTDHARPADTTPPAHPADQTSQFGTPPPADHTRSTETAPPVHPGPPADQGRSADPDPDPGPASDTTPPPAGPSSPSSP